MAEQPNNQQELTRLTLRLPDQLKNLLAEKAHREHRSLNAQIIKTLEEGVSQHRQAAA